jgi:hypothetical protein
VVRWFAARGSDGRIMGSCKERCAVQHDVELNAPNLFCERADPYLDVMPVLRGATEAFEVERIMWASASMQARTELGITRAKALYHVLESDRLSETEKQ